MGHGFGSVVRLIGVTMIFLGFLNIMVSIASDYALDLYSATVFFVGIALFIQSRVATWHKWPLVGTAVGILLIFYATGAVPELFKYLVFYVTILIVIGYLFWGKWGKIT
jgi:hypothetical protein